VLVSRTIMPNARDMSSMLRIMNPPVPAVRIVGPSSAVSNVVDRPRSVVRTSGVALVPPISPRPSIV
jgi:hypothetical protein